MLISVLFKNNIKFQSKMDNINEILTNIFTESMIKYCKLEKNMSTIYFLLMTLENLLFYNKKIIFKN